MGSTALRTRTVARLGIVVCIWTFAVMMLGGYTSATGAGLSCPDWPTCYGQWLPPFPSADNGGVDPATGEPVAYTNHQVMSEWVHRFVAAGLGPLLVAFTFFTWRVRDLPHGVRILPAAGISILFIQYVLGGLTVLRLSEPVLVTAHLGTATLFLVMMAIVTVLLYGVASGRSAAAGGPPAEGTPEDDESQASTRSSAGAQQEISQVRSPQREYTEPMRRRPDGVWRDPVAASVSSTSPAAAGAGMGEVPAPFSTPAPASGEAPFPAPGPVMTSPAATGFGSVLKDYVAMTKPRVMFLLVLTSVTAMFIALGGVPPLWPTVGVILGGAMATASSGAINHFLERDLDTQMARTKDRPVASGRVLPAHALLFGVTLGVLAFVVTWHLANLLAAFFVLCGLFFYVFVYTMWLKRMTYLNIVIGGAAGGFPALVGWAAATNSLGVGAWLLFALILVWTPPHFWALALVLREDYAKAGVPMLPVVKGIPRTTLEILVYSVVTVALSFAFFMLDVLGRIFLISATLLGGLLLLLALHLHLEPTKRTARTMFGYSILYLGLLFLAAFADVLV